MSSQALRTCAAVAIALVLTAPLPAQAARPLRLVGPDSATSLHRPLDRITVEIAPGLKAGRLVVSDGRGRVYVDTALGGDATVFTVRGALGWHVARLTGRKGSVLAADTFRVDTRTSVRTSSGFYDTYFARLQREMGEGRPREFGGRRASDGAWRDSFGQAGQQAAPRGRLGDS